MSKSVGIVIACILLIMVFALFFMAGYEKGASSVERQLYPPATSADQVSQDVSNKEVEVEKKISHRSKVLSDKQIMTAQRLRVASSFLDDGKNELVDEINYEFTHTAPLIVSKEPVEDYTIDSLAEDVINSEKTVNLEDLYSIRTEIYVYVGMFDEAGAVAASEYLQRIGFVPVIKHVMDGGVNYTFVVSGPFLLKDDAQRLVKYLKDFGYSSAKIIE